MATPAEEDEAAARELAAEVRKIVSGLLMEENRAAQAEVDRHRQSFANAVMAGFRLRLGQELHKQLLEAKNTALPVIMGLIAALREARKALQSCGSEGCALAAATIDARMLELIPEDKEQLENMEKTLKEFGVEL